VIRLPQDKAQAKRTLDQVINNHPEAQGFLIDRLDPIKYGGTGDPVDWSIMPELLANYHVPIILAGGLKPDNIAEAIRLVKPYGVDVSSGIEKGSPGIKDSALMRAFLAAVEQN